MTGAGKVIYGALNGSISATVTPRQDVNTRPVAVYSIESLEPTKSKGVIHARNYSARIMVYADTYAQAQNIAEAIVDIMESIPQTLVAGESVRYCSASFSGDSYDEEIGYGQDLTINLTLNEQ